MKRDLVQLWVTRETRQAIKVKSVAAGCTVVAFLKEQFNEKTQGTGAPKAPGGSG